MDPKFVDVCQLVVVNAVVDVLPRYGALWSILSGMISYDDIGELFQLDQDPSVCLHRVSDGPHLGWQ